MFQRPLESALILTSLASAISGKNLVYPLISIKVLQAILEGSRMILRPVTISIALAIIKSRIRSPVIRTYLSILEGCGGILSWILTILFPAFELPRVTGSKEVSSVDLELEDSNRSEWYSMAVSLGLV